MDNNNKLLLDISERLVRVETKIDDVIDIRQKAEDAKEIANKAELTSKRNAEDIKAMQEEAATQKRWIIGTVAGGVFSTASIVIAIVSLLN